MVNNQLITSGITNENILKSILTIPRHKFIPSKWQNVAYVDSTLPLQDNNSSFNINRFIMSPFVLATMLQRAELNSSSLVLDIGCATGYSSVIISDIVKKIIAIDEDIHLLEIAMNKSIIPQTRDNIAFYTFEYFKNNFKNYIFNVIFINGIVESIPETISNKLTEGGIIIAITKKKHLAVITKWIKNNNCLFEDSLLSVDADGRLLININNIY